MPRLRYYVGPAWPPNIGDYDYALSLCPSDLAWEFLRRNPDYQRDYRLSRRGSRQTRRLKWGHQLTRVRRYTQRSILWNLHPFCRSGVVGTRCSGLLVDGHRVPKMTLQPTSPSFGAAPPGTSSSAPTVKNT